MATSNPPVNGVAAVRYIQLRDFAIPGSFKASPTIAVGDFKVSQDTGALANLTTLPDVQPSGGTWVRIQLSAAEMTGDNIKVQCIDQTSPKEWSDFGFSIPTTAYAQGVAQSGDVYPLADTEIAAIKAKTDQLAFTVSNQVDANAITGGGTAPTAAQNADAVWDELRSGHTTVGSFGQSSQAVRSNTAQDGSMGTITLDASASATDDFYNGLWVAIVGGTGAGQIREITDYVGATKVASVTPNWTAPDNTSVFAIF